MCVTDEQAHAAMEAYYAAFRFGKQDGVYYSEEERLEAMRSAIEAALALSHAAGQGAVACYGLRRKGETAIIGLIPEKVHKLKPTSEEFIRDYEEVPLYLTPAQPPASAEVGRDAARLDWLMNECAKLEPFEIPTGAGDADIGWQVVTFHMDEPRERVIAAYAVENPRTAIDAAMAASSGRKGGGE